MDDYLNRVKETAYRYVEGVLMRGGKQLWKMGGRDLETRECGALLSIQF